MKHEGRGYRYHHHHLKAGATLHTHRGTVQAALLRPSLSVHPALPCQLHVEQDAGLVATINDSHTHTHSSLTHHTTSHHTTLHIPLRSHSLTATAARQATPNHILILQELLQKAHRLKHTQRNHKHTTQRIKHCLFSFIKDSLHTT